MMGICSTYCGSIYNDFFGIPLDLFGSKWVKPDDYDHENPNSPQYTTDGTYPYGIDPIWYKSDNELVFLNSFKMKVAVIFGVSQMVMGNLIKGTNAIYFKRPLDFIFEFIPQIVFMLGIFGYMVIMIFIKWGIDWNYNWDNTAPNLITVLMNMFLKLGSLDD